MPRQGDGSSDNGPLEQKPIVHGAGSEKLTDHVDRADNTAPMPEAEKGEALEGFNASAGASQPASQPTK